MRTTSRSAATALGGLLLVYAVSGCSYSYPFEMSGVVKDAASGAPLAGVSVTLEAGLCSSDNPFPVVTQPDGTFSANFRVYDGDFMGNRLPKWSLTLSREGYADLTIDVSPKQIPESTTKPTPIKVAARMEPK
jgi:hypothetical protein